MLVFFHISQELLIFIFIKISTKLTAYIYLVNYRGKNNKHLFNYFFLITA